MKFHFESETKLFDCIFKANQILIAHPVTATDIIHISVQTINFILEMNFSGKQILNV